MRQGEGAFAKFRNCRSKGVILPRVIRFSISIAVAVLGASSAAAEPSFGRTGPGEVQNRPASEAPAASRLRTAQTELRRRFIPAENQGGGRWVAAQDRNEEAASEPSSDNDPVVDPYDPAPPETAQTEPSDAIDGAAPIPASPRRVPISPAAREARAEALANATPRCDIPTCSARYRSFDPADCTYQPNYGPRTICQRGDPESRRSVAAWRRQFSPSPEPTPAANPAATIAPMQTPVPAQGGGQAAAVTPDCDIPTCEARYRSFDASDCTYQPFYGGRTRCTRGDPQSAASIAAWRSRESGEAILSAADEDAASARAAAREALAKAGAESAAARAEAYSASPPVRASASVSAAGDKLLSWIDLLALALFTGFCLHAFVRLWSPPSRGVP